MLAASNDMIKDGAAPNADPIITFTAQQFNQELQSVSQMLSSGHLQPAQNSLSQIGNYCISCHSRADRGSKNFPMAWATNLSALSTTQKIQYSLANRQYESAHKETEKLIKDETLVAQDPNSWISTVQKDLSVIIRAEQDLPHAQKLIAEILTNKNLPEYMKYDIKSWAKSLTAWQKETKKSKESTRDLEFVKKLIDQARATPYSQGQAAFVIYLRASGILHELLESSRNSPTYSSTLYFAGIAADALKSVDVWKLGEHYFEVCIDNRPNSLIAQNCYHQLEAIVLQSHPNMNLMPELSKNVLNRLAKYKEQSRVLNPYIDKLRPNESGPGY